MLFTVKEGFVLIEVSGISSVELQQIKAFLTHEVLVPQVVADYASNGEYKPNTGRYSAFFPPERASVFVEWLQKQGFAHKAA